MSEIMNNPNELKVVNIRMVREPSLYSSTPVATPKDAMSLIAKELATYDREVFGVLNLKSNGQVLNMNICSVGTLNASLVSNREVMKSAILSNAAAFLAFHVHPSGNPQPSQEDVTITGKLAKAGELLDIRLMDHIIIAGGSGDTFSFHENGMMGDISRNARTAERER